MEQPDAERKDEVDAVEDATWSDAKIAVTLS